MLLAPNLRVTEEYDDNVLLSATNRKSDFITGITPRLRLTVNSDPLFVDVDGSVRAEYYVERPERDNLARNATGTGTVQFRATPSLSFSLTERYLRSVEAATTDLETGIILGRSESSTNTTIASGTYSFSRDTSMLARYTYSNFKSDSGSTLNSSTQEIDSSLSHHFEVLPRDTITARLLVDHFNIDGVGTQNSFSPRLGWARQVTGTLKLSGDVGPLYIEQPDGSTSLDVGASGEIDYEFRSGTFNLKYSRAPRLAGRTGVAGLGQTLSSTTTLQLGRSLSVSEGSVITQTESVTGEIRSFSTQVTASYMLLQNFTITGGLSLINTTSSGGRAVSGVTATTTDFATYSATLNFTYRFRSWLSFDLLYRHQAQTDRSGPNSFDRNVVTFGISLSDQFRLY